jgi:hypothetical protein
VSKLYILNNSINKLANQKSSPLGHFIHQSYRQFMRSQMIPRMVVMKKTPPPMAHRAFLCCLRYSNMAVAVANDATIMQCLSTVSTGPLFPNWINGSAITWDHGCRVCGSAAHSRMRLIGPVDSRVRARGFLSLLTSVRDVCSKVW